ncbi:MAG: hypothetical protein NT003_03085 [Candidatus Magasanikbacteria bacterium]|nr:hypothetical protein [Candidatus Magasanikbacteria bacterium]
MDSQTAKRLRIVPPPPKEVSEVPQYERLFLSLVLRREAQVGLTVPLNWKCSHAAQIVILDEPFLVIEYLHVEPLELYIEQVRVLTRDRVLVPFELGTTKITFEKPGMYLVRAAVAYTAEALEDEHLFENSRIQAEIKCTISDLQLSRRIRLALWLKGQWQKFRFW